MADINSRMSGFMTPEKMALMGLAQGLFAGSAASPREINLGEAMGMGMGGAMQGMMAGQDMQSRQMENQMRQSQLQRQLDMKQKLEQLTTDFKDPKMLSQALITSGYPELMEHGLRMAPKVKNVVKGYDENNKPVYHSVMADGSTSSTGIPIAEKAMQVNTGGQIQFRDAYNPELMRGSVNATMAPGESARLAQSDRHHAQSQGIAQQRLLMDRAQLENTIRQQQKPQFKDGYWVTPPNAQNPQGTVLPTEIATAPKGSQAEKAKLSGKVAETLGNDTEDLIKQATGSGFGTIADMGLAGVGISTKSGDAAHKLKMRAATLAGNMPRFEGPQSDADRQYYMQMVGEIGDPTVPPQRKLAALEELRRLHKLDSTAGSSQQGSGLEGFSSRSLD